MESISQLRAICQKPKVSEREEIGMSYQDMLTQYRLGLSVYFTWVFIYFGISANTVTIFSGVAAIIGGILLSFNNIWFVVIGILFVEFYYLLDFCDGEVARYHKKGSIIGWFLDWYMLFVRDAAVFIGLAFAAYNIEPSKLILICGFLSVLTPIMDKTIIGCGWTVIGWTRLKDLHKGTNNKKGNKALNFENKKELFNNKKSIILKIIKGVGFLSNSIFQHAWSPVLLLLLAINQIVVNSYVDIEFDFRPYLILYCGIYGPFYVFNKLFLVVKRNSMEEKYNVLFHNEGKITEKDYFF